MEVKQAATSISCDKAPTSLTCFTHQAQSIPLHPRNGWIWNLLDTDDSKWKTSYVPNEQLYFAKQISKTFIFWFSLTLFWKLNSSNQFLPLEPQTSSTTNLHYKSLPNLKNKVGFRLAQRQKVMNSFSQWGHTKNKSCLHQCCSSWPENIDIELLDSQSVIAYAIAMENSAQKWLIEETKVKWVIN